MGTQGSWNWLIRDALCASGPGGFWFGGVATPFIRYYSTTEDEEVCAYILVVLDHVGFSMLCTLSHERHGSARSCIGCVNQVLH
jgi:hypothetical protein